MTIFIGRSDGDFLRISALGRMHGNARDYWDGNWLITDIEVHVGAFRAAVGATLRSEELASFRQDLARVHDSLQGEAVLASMEGWIDLRIRVEPDGHLFVEGAVTDALDRARVLAFRISGMDQTDLPKTLEGLDEVVAAFPVLGVEGGPQ